MIKFPSEDSSSCKCCTMSMGSKTKVETYNSIWICKYSQRYNAYDSASFYQTWENTKQYQDTHGLWPSSQGLTGSEGGLIMPNYQLSYKQTMQRKLYLSQECTISLTQQKSNSTIVCGPINYISKEVATRPQQADIL